jgi:hypothetical protein
MVIYAYNHHVRLLSPEPAVVKQPQFTRVEEPTLLCNHVAPNTHGHLDMPSHSDEHNHQHAAQGPQCRCKCSDFSPVRRVTPTIEIHKPNSGADESEGNEIRIRRRHPTRIKPTALLLRHSRQNRKLQDGPVQEPEDWNRHTNLSQGKNFYSHVTTILNLKGPRTWILYRASERVHDSSCVVGLPDNESGLRLLGPCHSVECTIGCKACPCRTIFNET